MAFAKECHPGAGARSWPADVWKDAQNFLHKMEFTTSLTKNYEFKRIYNKGKSAASKCVVVYCSRNGKTENRLGITVSTKLGGAVQRNRIRRRLKEIYRLNEYTLRAGYNIVIVARNRSRFAGWIELESSVISLFKRLGIANVSASAGSGYTAGREIYDETCTRRHSTVL